MSDSSPATEVRPYDFKSPVRIMADQRKRLKDNQAALAKPFAAALAARLGTGCELAFQDIVEGASERLFSTAFDPVFRLAPFVGGGQVYVRIAAPLAQAVIDRLLGGVGTLREVEREPTEIESTLLRLIVGALRAAVAQSWGAQAAPAHAPVYLSAEERHATESVEGASGVFSMLLGDAMGTLEVFFSHEEIARTLGLEDAGAKAAARSGTMTWEHVGDVAVEMAVQWPPTPIRIRDLAALQVGDIVHLDHKLGDELIVLLGGRAAFRGYPGAVEDAFGVRITRTL